MSEPLTDTEAGPEAASGPVPEWPGLRLRRVREERNMSRGEVASRLHLREQLVAALEDNDESRLPPATYVGGYIRSYARLMDLPVDELVSGYEGFLKAEPSISNVQDRAQASSKDWPVRLVTYLIILALGAFAGKSLFFSEPTPEQAAEPASQQPAPSDAGEGTGAAEGAEPGTAQAPGADETAATAGSEVPAEGGEGAESPAGDATDAAPETSAPVTQGQESAAPSTAAKPEPVVVSPLGPNVPQSELVLQFEADCWTDVQDAGGRKLVYRLVKAGNSLTLRGEAPFRVFLGYAPGVAVRYNGAAVDTLPYRRQDMARFTLGKAADNQVPTR